MQIVHGKYHEQDDAAKHTSKYTTKYSRPRLGSELLIPYCLTGRFGWMQAACKVGPSVATGSPWPGDTSRVSDLKKGPGDLGAAETRPTKTDKSPTAATAVACCGIAIQRIASGFRRSSSVPRVTPTRLAALSRLQTSRPVVRPASRSR